MTENSLAKGKALLEEIHMLQEEVNRWQNATFVSIRLSDGGGYRDANLTYIAMSELQAQITSQLQSHLNDMIEQFEKL